MTSSALAAASTAQNYGEVFTRRWVVEAMLDLAEYTPEKDLTHLTVVEPSVGTGAFWGPLVERLVQSALEVQRPFESLAGCLRGWDLRPEHVDTCKALTASVLLASGCDPLTATLLADAWLRTGDFLLDEEVPRADLVVGNPPYIRYDDLPSELAYAYRRRWSTMSGRGDIFVGFIQRGLELLNDGGRLTYICADRWMRNAYGADLREFVSTHAAVEAIWQMHNVDAFEAAVSAYPAIVQFRNGPQGEAVIADCGARFTQADALSIIRFAQDPSKAERLHLPDTAAHRVHGWFTGKALWPAGSPDRIALLEDLNERFQLLEATGVKVGIGIATGADKAYIVDASVDVEPDRKLPIVVTNDIRSGEFSYGGKVLLNPWAPDGSIINLDDFPKLKRELSAHAGLRERFVAKRNPGTWWRTIDKVNYSLIERPKILIQDMKALMTPVLDPGGHYPAHNLYHLTSDRWDLEVLGGLLLSRVTQAFIEAYGVKMRGGTLRMQAQYLRTIRVPAPETINQAIAQDLRTAFRTRDRGLATKASMEAYGIDDIVW
ncbi:Eco57I restriction-modification methylase domain-containing protein [Nocardioides aestuarii]|uniref:site-specific DNA-methyltransferase (adenine-specific) n=1 Tax=Nocardioides aestuarii TaxID=252231 RepID=A0ABW4TPB4_9ACTN